MIQSSLNLRSSMCSLLISFFLILLGPSNFWTSSLIRNIIKNILQLGSYILNQHHFKLLALLNSFTSSTLSCCTIQVLGHLGLLQDVELHQCSCKIPQSYLLITQLWHNFIIIQSLKPHLCIRTWLLLSLVSSMFLPSKKLSSLWRPPQLINLTLTGQIQVSSRTPSSYKVSLIFFQMYFNYLSTTILSRRHACIWGILMAYQATLIYLFMHKIIQ